MPDKVQVLSTSSTMDGADGAHETRSKQVYGRAQRSIRVVIQLKIENFEILARLTTPGHYVESKPVISPLTPEVAWKLSVYPNGDQRLVGGKCTFLVELVTGLAGEIGNNPGSDGEVEERDRTRKEPREFNPIYKIYLANADGDEAVEIQSPTQSYFTENGSAYGKHKVCRDTVKEGCQDDGSLLVVAQIDMLLSPADDDGDSGPHEKEKESSSRRDGLITVACCETDCLVKVDGCSETFKVHSGFLSACSKSFQAMFDEQNNEVKQEEGEEIVGGGSDVLLLNLTNFPLQSIKAMLEYAYTGEVNWDRYKGWEADVLRLADKYEIFELKALVGERLTAGINTSPARLIQVAQLGDTHACPALKKACASYLAGHFLEVVASPEWEHLKSSSGKLALQLLEMALNAGECPPPVSLSSNEDDTSSTIISTASDRDISTQGDDGEEQSASGLIDISSEDSNNLLPTDSAEEEGGQEPAEKRRKIKDEPRVEEEEIY